MCGAGDLGLATLNSHTRTQIDPDTGEQSTSEEYVVRDTPLLVNIKGCGYPPTIVCDDYAETYSNYSLVTASCLVCVTVRSDVAGRSNLPLLLLPDEPVDRAVPVQRGRGGHQRRHDNTVTSRL